MKKILKILSISLFVIIVTLIAVPYFFKDDIEKFIKDEINNSINAKLDYDDVSLSLFTDFPNLYVKIKNIRLDGINEFKNVRLAYIDRFNMSLDAMRLFTEKDLEIKKINLEGADLKIKVLKNGKANYDIDKPDTLQNQTSEKNYVIKLKSFTIKNANVNYDDQSLGINLKIKNLNHNGSGVFNNDTYKLDTQTQIDTLDVVYDNMHYLNNVKTLFNAGILIENDFSKYSIQKALLSLNDLELLSDMIFELKGDDINMDITYRTKENSLKKLLSLVPKTYMPDIKGLKTNGQTTLTGFVKGTYNDKVYPGFGLDFNINNGYIKYPDLPQSVKDINVVSHIKFPGGDNLDKTEIDLPEIHFKIAGNTADGRLAIHTPVSDPYIDTHFSSKMDLAQIKQAVYLPEIKKLSGILDADIKLKGRSSAIEKQEFDKFEAAGHFDLSNMQYISDSLDYPVGISSAKIIITPQSLDVQQFKSKVGQSDFDINGKVSNYITYFLKKNQVLKAGFNMHSNYINLNEFMTDDKEEGTTEKTQDSLIRIPENLDIVFKASADKVRYKDMNLNNLKGNILVKNQKAELQTVLAKAFGGTIKLNGTYDTSEETAKSAMKVTLEQVAINQTAGSLTMLQNYAPVMQKINGNFFTDFQMNVALDNQMNPVLKTLEANGLLKTSQINVSGIEIIQSIGKMLKINALENPKVDKVKAQFSVNKGKLNIKPFEFKLNNIPANLGGSVSVDQKLDLALNMNIPRKMLGNKANEIIGNLIGKANSLGLNISTSDIIKMQFKIGGSITNPKIVPVVGGVEGSSVKEVVTEAVTQKVEETVEKAKDKAREEARKQADKILAQAQAQADKIKAEAKKAADKIRAEARKQADEVIKKAGDNPIKKMAAESLAKNLIKKADQKANQLETKAENQANLIMKNAREKADKLTNGNKK